MKVLSKYPLNRLSLAPAEQAVIYKNTRELIADRVVKQRRRHAGIHAATETEKHMIFANLRAHFGTGLLNERAHRPIHVAATDAIDEILQNLPAARGVRDLGMKLDAVELLFRLLDGREWRVVGVTDGTEATREFCQFVAMGIPDVHGVAQFGKERAFPADLELTATVFTLGGMFDFPAEVMGHELHAVADAENRNAQIENLRVWLRRALRINTGWAAAQDQPLRREGTQFRGRRIVREDLRVNLTLANPPRDDLGVLRPEIEDDEAGSSRTSHASSRHGTARG